jgi:hypothetical protein
MIGIVKPGRLLVLCSRNAGSRVVTEWPRSARARQKRPSNRAAYLLCQEDQSPSPRLPVHDWPCSPRTAQNNASTGSRTERSTGDRGG